MKVKIKISKNGSLAIALYIFIYLFVFVYCYMNQNVEGQLNNILFLGYVTDLIFALGAYSLYKLENNKFGLCHVVALFFFLFNFGQIFLWNIGIHSSGELGKAPLYGVYSPPSLSEIFQAQVFASVCFSSLMLGMIISSLFRPVDCPRQIDKLIEDVNTKALYRFSIIMGIVIVPLTFIKILLELIQSSLYGYITLYTDDLNLGYFVSRAEDYFFPVIVGLLLGSKYKKVKFVYILFGMYMILYLLAGERGNWVYKLVVLIVMHNTFYKKINFKTAIKYILFGLIGLYIVGIVVDLREYGLANITSAQIENAINLNDNFLTRFLSEMGSSLSIIIMVYGFGRGAFTQFGNTFVSSFFASFSSAISRMFGIEHVFLATYLSRNLLKIGWGTGFNLFAEFFINYGYFGSVLVLIFGLIVGMILKGTSNLNEKSAIKCYFSCVLCSIICSMARDSVLGGFRQIIQVVLFTYIVIAIYSKILSKKTERNNDLK